MKETICERDSTLKKVIDAGVKKLTELALEGYPIENLPLGVNVSIKPTRYEQHCQICGKQLLRGQWRVKARVPIMDGPFFTFHLACFLARLIYQIVQIENNRK